MGLSRCRLTNDLLLDGKSVSQLWNTFVHTNRSELAFLKNLLETSTCVDSTLFILLSSNEMVRPSGALALHILLVDTSVLLFLNLSFVSIFDGSLSMIKLFISPVVSLWIIYQYTKVACSKLCSHRLSSSFLCKASFIDRSVNQTDPAFWTAQPRTLICQLPTRNPVYGFSSLGCYTTFHDRWTKLKQR